MKKPFYLVVIAIVLSVVLSIAYYLVVLLPQKRAKKGLSNKVLLQQCLDEANERLDEALESYESVVSEEYLERSEDLYQKQKEECIKKYPVR